MKEIKTHSKRKHSKFPASASARWMGCPGSVALCEKAPPQVENFAMREGTDGHECLEWLVKRFANLEAAAVQAKKKWSEEMVDYAVISAKKIFELKPSKNAKLLIETRVSLKTISKEMFGTLDYAWVENWGTLIALDYKYGAGYPVLPRDLDTGKPNSQLMYYALGLAHKYNWEFDTLKLGIIQPRVWREDDNPLSLETFPIKALRDFEKEIREAVRIAKSPNAPLNPSEDACRWCPASTICPALSKMTLAGVGVQFDIDEGLGEVPDPKLMTPERLGRALDAADLLEIWINDVRVQAELTAMKGEKIEGRKLVQKRSTRSWLPEAEKIAAQNWGAKIYDEPKFLSPAQLEKAIGKEAKSFTEKYTSNVSSGLVLARASDRRPEVNPNPFDEDESSA